MSDKNDLIGRLDAHLRVRLSPATVREAHAVARTAERSGRRSGTRRRGLIALVVAAGLGLGGGAVAYAAPQTWQWLFPTDISKSLTFASGRTCTVEITVRADYSSVGAHGATPAQMSAMQDVADSIDPSKLDLEPYLEDARARFSTLLAESPDMVERAALGSAIYDEMMRVSGGPNGATWSTETSCD